METISQIKRPSLHPSDIKPEWLPVLPSVQVETTNPSGFQFVGLMPHQAAPPLRYSLDKPFSEVLGEFVVDVIAGIIKNRWKEVAPGSYMANQLVYSVAPYCRPEASGLLNLAVLVTAGYGLKQIADAEGH
jgi:hypothetical protein